MRTLLFFLPFLIVDASLLAQKIGLKNPSFENDKAQCCITPSGWYNCSTPQTAQLDVQPGTNGVDVAAAAGNNYVCLAVRDDESWDAIGQELAEPLKKGSHYVLKLFCARSVKMTAPTKTTPSASYATPVRLRIWGGNRPCDKEELLAESTIIQNTDWLEVELNFQPLSDFAHISLEAFYNTPMLFPYNGNILIDNLLLSQIP